MITSSRRLVVLALALAASLAVGCGRVPTAPTAANTAPVSAPSRSTDTGAAPVSVASRSADAGTASVGAPRRNMEPAARPMLAGVPDLDPTQIIVREVDLVGSVGGTLSNGRWRVDMPPNAIDGAARIGLATSNVVKMVCGLEILPADKNGFGVPATLTVDCREVSDYHLRRFVILWYDPAAKTWVPVVGSKANLATRTVSAPLMHFSTYSVGPCPTKAGW